MNTFIFPMKQTSDQILKEIEVGIKVMGIWYVETEKILNIEDLDVFLEKAQKLYTFRPITNIAELKEVGQDKPCYEFKKK